MRLYRAAPIIALFAVAGCASYDPPVQADHTSEKYQTDLTACRTSTTEAVRRKNADTPWTWMRSPFTGPPEVRAGIRTCMAGKGYLVGKTGDETGG